MNRLTIAVAATGLLALGACAEADTTDEAANTQVEELDAATDDMAVDGMTETDEAQLEGDVADLEADAADETAEDAPATEE